MRGRERTGALLRIETPAWQGFADCHPWTELGDPSLADQLSCLAAGRPLALAARSLEHARADGEARARGRSAFDGLTVPASHLLCSDIVTLTADGIDAAAAIGYRRVKAKVGRDWPAELACLVRLLPKFQTNKIQLRLDFNASAPGGSAAWSDVPKALRELLDFIEDPCPWSAGAWRELSDAGAPLAFDRPDPGLSPAVAYGQDARAFSTVVLKPAVQDVLKLARDLPAVRLAVTSYLDHPLGQASAAREAARLAGELPAHRLLIGGLRSETAYEASEFSDALGPAGPAFPAPEGTGLGFDLLLERLPWKELTA